MNSTCNYGSKWSQCVHPVKRYPIIQFTVSDYEKPVFCVGCNWLTLGWSLALGPIYTRDTLLYFSRLGEETPVHELWRHMYEQASHRDFILASLHATCMYVVYLEWIWYIHIVNKPFLLSRLSRVFSIEREQIQICEQMMNSFYL